MKVIATSAAVLGIGLVVAMSADATSVGSAPTPVPALAGTTARVAPVRSAPLALEAHAAAATAEVPTVPARAGIPSEGLTEVVHRVCGLCHNEQLKTGNLVLTSFDVGAAPESPEIAEKMITKLRAGMMPPPGIPRPSGDTLQALVETLEKLIDDAAAKAPNPGGRTFQRLNRSEYHQSIKGLLDLDIDAGDYLPLDTKSANFDNIADVQMLSPTPLDAYLNAASQIARLAIGDASVTPSEKTYEKPGYFSQWDRVEGAPFGSRGGISVVHNFPADGKYALRMAFDHTTTGGYYGSTARFEQLEISVNGERKALLDMDAWMHVSDPNGVNMESGPIFVKAGPQRVSAVFIRRSEGPVEDLTSPHEWSLADRQIGAGGYGITALPHMKDLSIVGPYDVAGVSETPSRRRIFTCRPSKPAQAAPCAKQILTGLATQAYRRPLTDADVADFMRFYEEGARGADFEAGVRTGLQAILSSPDFVFRFELPDHPVRPGVAFRINDYALASRLSFFLWGTPPDQELEAVARQHKLSGAVLDAQVRRMLADPRSEALATRFAAQWLRLQDLNKVHPDAFWFPDYDQQLADAMRRETELFFYNLVREDRSVLELFSADYTFVNDRLARHYGIPDITGPEFRRIQYPDDRRKGLLGHGSILTLTSHANRTSPVLRGKWVMEVLLGTPPPPPPAGVPDLEQTKGAAEGRMLTTRERMEQHRANMVCRSCHQFMDPMGLALDNFDVTGKWRIRENGMELDTRGQLYDCTPLASPEDLRQALLRRPTPLIRTFTGNLMAYALGRRVEFYDKPTVRKIARDAEANGYRMSSFILGIVHSDAFQMMKESAAAQDNEQKQH